MSHRLVFAITAVVTLIPLTACHNADGIIEDVARTYHLSGDDAARAVSELADEAGLSTHAAASKLLDEASVTVPAGGSHITLEAFLQRADDVANDVFDQAVSATYRHAMFVYRTTGQVDPNDLYRTLETEFDVAIADRLFQTGVIGTAISVAQALEERDPSKATLMLAELAYC
jgi:hypothetical protein